MRDKVFSGEVACVMCDPVAPGRLAQLVERLLYTQVAAGSSPAPPIEGAVAAVREPSEPTPEEAVALARNLRHFSRRWKMVSSCRV
jgi:hypothetical protein